LHDQLASLGRHAQLTCCFSAVAELLVHILEEGKIDALLRRSYCCGFSQHPDTFRQLLNKSTTFFLQVSLILHTAYISFSHLPTLLSTCSSATEDTRTVSENVPKEAAVNV